MSLETWVCWSAAETIWRSVTKMAGKLAQRTLECRCFMALSHNGHDDINQVADFKFVAR